jgi:hypothetical protein
MKKIQDHNVVYFSIWFIHIAEGTPQWPRFHIQCQIIQIATLIIITIHGDFDILSDVRLYIYQNAADGEGFNYLKVNLQLSGVIANPSQSTAFWCYCHYLLWNTHQFYDWEGWCWDEVSSLHPGDLGACPKENFETYKPRKKFVG